MTRTSQAETTKRQGGCCTFVLHPSDNGLTAPEAVADQRGDLWVARCSGSSRPRADHTRYQPVRVPPLVRALAPCKWPMRTGPSSYA